MTNWTLSKALVKRVAKAIQAAATGNWMEDGEARAYARAALDASPIGELVEALRKHAILRRERPAIQGIFIPNGFHCNECGTDWGGKGEPVNERHHETCILARANGTGDNND